MRPAEGMRIGGRYLLHARIAAGGMGEVWRAVDDVLGRTVAVKTLKPGLSDDSEFVQRFRAEARNAARLANGHIAQLHDYGEGDGIAFLVMEFVDGQPLSRIITDRAPLPVPQVVDLLAQCCDALGDAHTKGIVHRDVKPANIVVTGSGTAKLTDFGIARAADNSSLTQAGEVMGTPMYLAPEAAMGQEATGRSDLYSLAVVAYQMLTGRLPFHADTPIGYAMAHVNQPPDPLPASLPHGIRDAVSSALAKRPEERPASMAAFASMLRAVVPPGVATVVTPTVRPPDPDPAQGPEAETVRAPLPGTSAGASEEQPAPSAAPTVTEERCPPAVEPLRVGANAVLHGTALQVHLEAVEPLDLLAFELDAAGRVLADERAVVLLRAHPPRGIPNCREAHVIRMPVGQDVCLSAPAHGVRMPTSHPNLSELMHGACRDANTRREGWAVGLISIRPSSLRASRQDPASLRIGSSLVAGCVVVAFIGVPLLVLLAIVALLVQPGDGILTPALVALAVVACCWVATLVVGVVLTVVGRREVAQLR